MQKYFISATNIRGLGAKNLVSSMLIKKYFPEHTFIFMHKNCINIKTDLNVILLNKFMLPYLVYRFVEIFILFLKIKKYSYKFITLGDIPYYNIKNQIVLFHNPHICKSHKILIKDKSFFRIINKLIFEFNMKYVDRYIVQTSHIKKNLISAYPKIASKVKIIRFPVSLINSKEEYDKYNYNFTHFFYPARYGNGYEHKNHKLIFEIDNNFFEKQKFSIILTTKIIKSNYGSVKYVGELNPSEVNKYYNKCHVLLFLSTDETFGMPLIEAMHHNLPIVCPDLPYALEICENKAFYYKNNCIKSLKNAMQRASNFVLDKNSIDYSRNLSLYKNKISFVVDGLISD